MSSGQSRPLRFLNISFFQGTQCSVNWGGALVFQASNKSPVFHDMTALNGRVAFREKFHLNFYIKFITLCTCLCV